MAITDCTDKVFVFLQLWWLLLRLHDFIIGLGGQLAEVVCLIYWTAPAERANGSLDNFVVNIAGVSRRGLLGSVGHDRLGWSYTLVAHIQDSLLRSDGLGC